MNKPIQELIKEDNKYIFNGKTFHRSSAPAISYANKKEGIVLHRYIYEYYNGPIDKDQTVIFKDGNRKNLDIDNLVVVTKSSVASNSRMSHMNTKLKKDHIRYKLEEKYKVNG